MRYLQNTIMVLAVTVLTVGAVYTGVTAFGSSDLGTAVVDGSGTVQVCPATGCTSVGCHATDDSSGGSYTDGGTGYHGRGMGHGYGGYPAVGDPTVSGSSI